MISPKLITGPTIEPATLAEAKLALRIDDLLDATENAAQEARLTFLLKAARQACEAFAGKTWNDTTWEYVLDDFPSWHTYSVHHHHHGAIVLPRATPLIEVVSITYRDSGGTITPWAATHYVEDADSEPGRVLPAYGETWPSFTPYPTGAVRVRYRAGLELTSPVTPDEHAEVRKLATLMLMAHWWQNPEPAQTTGAAGSLAVTPLMERTIKGLLTIAGDCLPSDC